MHMWCPVLSITLRRINDFLLLSGDQKRSVLQVRDASYRSLFLCCPELYCCINKTRPYKVACTQFYSVLPMITGRPMDMLVEFNLVCILLLKKSANTKNFWFTLDREQ